MNLGRGAAVLWLFTTVACCSGDEGNRRGPTLRPMPTTVVAGDGGTPSTAATAGLTPEMAVAYFTTGRAKVAADHYARDNFAAARQAFADARRDAKRDDDKARLSLMIALCDAELGRWNDAAAGFAAVAPRLGVLDDWLTFQEARARYFAHQPDRALELAQSVSPDSITGADAELLVGDILRARGSSRAVAAHYRSYLQRRPRGIRRSEARFRLAEALESEPDGQVEMVATYRAIAIEDPLSGWSAQANSRLAALGNKLPPDLRRQIGTYRAGEHITRGMVLFDAMRNPESEAAFTAALAAPGITPAETCVASYHRAQSRMKARDRRNAALMFDDAAEKCQAAGDKDLWLKSLYTGARAQSFIRDNAKAIERYQAASRVDPAHSYNDDALLREAEEWTELGDLVKAKAALESIPVRFPGGDMRAEAMWRRGWLAYREGDLAAATTWWQKQIDLVPIDDNYWAEGQAQYWIGRARAAQGQLPAAMASWEAAVRLYPLSYYSLLALSRLREADAGKHAALLAELAKDPPGFDPAGPAFTFRPRPEWASPGFLRALEFLRLGLGGAAEAELRKLGLTSPNDRKRVDDPDQIDKLWAIAYLYNLAGRYGDALWPTRWHILDYRRDWPRGQNRARWQIAYPRGYWALLNEHATKNQALPEMLIAIVREESGFDPLRESYANAIGLTQMIFPTAQRFAKGTGIAVSRETLRDPVKNVTIGSRFLGFLFQKWKGFTLLVPPSYNAGEGAVTRMLRLRGTWAADEFIEGIIDDQARNYSKRVLASYFTYSWLYAGKAPYIPNTIPTELLPPPQAGAADKGKETDKR